MNMLDLADIHAAAMGLDEFEGPDVLQVEPPPPSPPRSNAELIDMLLEDAKRRKRVRKRCQRPKAPRPFKPTA